MLVTVAPAVSVDAPEIDAEAVRRGLEVRLGETSRGWEIEISSTHRYEQLYARLRSPAGREIHRAIVLEGVDTEERSRELASALALIMDEHVEPQETDAPQPGPAPQPTSVSGWVAIGPRFGLGPPTSLHGDGGLAARGGAWLANEHVQPIAALSWSRSRRGELVLDGLRMGAGVAFGSALLERRLWLGAGVVPHAMWTRAADRRAVASWRSSTELAGLLQVRGRWWLLAARTGLDLTLPPVRARGVDATLRWGAARFVFGIEFGLVLPPSRSASNVRQPTKE
jgi:hypothetical protein